jgi:hypothetical protein
MLTALVALPVLWWLLRITPPSPKPQIFPPLRLLLGLIPKEETPAHTPWWLLLLRLVIAALVIFALARPVLNPDGTLVARGPLVLVIDDGWAAAADWTNRVDAMLATVDEAERQGRPMLLLGTAAPANGAPLLPSKLMPASEARGVVQGWRPKPWASDRMAAARALGEMRFNDAGDVVWIGDGIDDAAAQGQAYALAERLQWFGSVRVLTTAHGAKALLPPTLDGATMKIRAARARAGVAEPLFVVASAEQGRVLAREPLLFEPDATLAEAPLNLPTELRNRLTRLDIEGAGSAGATVLLDERWRRRPVGLVSGSSQDKQQPLLSLLSRPRAQPIQRSAPRQHRRPVAARTGGAGPVGHRADRRQRRPLAGAVDPARRRAHPFRRPASGREQRQPHAGDGAHRRRPPIGRRDVMGATGDAGAVPREQPVFRPGPAQRRNGEAAGAGRTRHQSQRQDLGAAGRRHTAGDRRKARPGLGGAVPHHGQYLMGQPCHLRPVRRYAAAHGGSGAGHCRGRRH